MADLQEMDVDQVIEKIRAAIRERRKVMEGASTPVADRAVSADLATLHAGYDLLNVPLASPHRLWGPGVVFLKKLLLRLLAPVFARQTAFNASNARLATHLEQRFEALVALREYVEALHREQAKLWKENLALGEHITALEQVLRVMRERVSRTERKLRRVLYALTPSGEGEPRPGERPTVPAKNLDWEFDYVGFQERWRGSEEDIKARQRVYLDYFRGHESVLDIGCGRGEFLELLHEAGIEASGVDLDLDMVLAAREKGLEVAREDVFAYLRALPDESLGGIFAAQIIEHLEAARVIELAKLCHAKLRPGSVLIMETPNPKCLLVLAETFYMDLSHIRPIHPEAMKFLLESVGFQGVEVKFSAPVEPSMRIPPLRPFGDTEDGVEGFNRGIERLNEMLWGFQDYAVIGVKGPGGS